MNQNKQVTQPLSPPPPTPAAPRWRHVSENTGPRERAASCQCGSPSGTSCGPARLRLCRISLLLLFPLRAGVNMPPLRCGRWSPPRRKNDSTHQLSIQLITVARAVVTEWQRPRLSLGRYRQTVPEHYQYGSVSHCCCNTLPRAERGLKPSKCIILEFGRSKIEMGLSGVPSGLCPFCRL